MGHLPALLLAGVPFLMVKIIAIILCKQSVKIFLIPNLSRTQCSEKMDKRY